MGSTPFKTTPAMRASVRRNAVSDRRASLRSTWFARTTMSTISASFANQKRVGDRYDRRCVHDDPGIAFAAFFEEPLHREAPDESGRIRRELAGSHRGEVLLPCRLADDVELEIFRAVIREPRFPVES